MRNAESSAIHISENRDWDRVHSLDFAATATPAVTECAINMLNLVWKLYSMGWCDQFQSLLCGTFNPNYGSTFWSKINLGFMVS